MRETPRLLDPRDLWGRVQLAAIEAMQERAAITPDAASAWWEVIAARAFHPAPKYLN